MGDIFRGKGGVRVGKRISGGERVRLIWVGVGVEVLT